MEATGPKSIAEITRRRRERAEAGLLDARAATAAEIIRFVRDYSRSRTEAEIEAGVIEHLRAHEVAAKNWAALLPRERA